METGFPSRQTPRAFARRSCFKQRSSHRRSIRSKPRADRSDDFCRCPVRASRGLQEAMILAVRASLSRSASSTLRYGLARINDCSGARSVLGQHRQRVAGTVDQGQARSDLTRPVGKFPATHAAGHDDIREKHINTGIGPQFQQGSIAIDGRDNRISETFDPQNDRRANEGIVFRDQYRLMTARDGFLIRANMIRLPNGPGTASPATTARVTHSPKRRISICCFSISCCLIWTAWKRGGSCTNRTDRRLRKRARQSAQFE